MCGASSDYWANGSYIMSYSRVVSVVLVLWEVGSILGNGYEIWGQNSIKGKFQ